MAEESDEEEASAFPQLKEEDIQAASKDGATVAPWEPLMEGEKERKPVYDSSTLEEAAKQCNSWRLNRLRTEVGPRPLKTLVWMQM